MEADIKSASQDTTRQGEKSGSSDSVLANSILVSHDFEDDESESHDISGVKDVEASRLEIIKKRMIEQNLDLTTIGHLKHKHRKETIDNYNRNWQKWATWCNEQSPKVDCMKYDPKVLLKYLVQNKQFSTSHLNGIRAPIVSVFNVVYPEKSSIGQHHLRDFFTAHKKQKIKVKTKEDLEIWDLDILLNFIQRRYGDNDSLTATELQQKTVLLLAIFTMWRPKSDIGRSQYRDVVFHYDNNEVTGVSLIYRLPKEAQQKTTTLGASKNQNLCPVKTLQVFVQQTEKYRGKLREDQTLFLAYLNEQKPTSSVSPNTVTAWIKNSIAEAGVDTIKYNPHSIRSASSTKAVQLLVPIKDVKDHANWSQQSHTFEKYYYKPNQKDKISTAIKNKMIDNITENNTISGVRTKAKSIGLGTSCNFHLNLRAPNIEKELSEQGLKKAITTAQIGQSYCTHCSHKRQLQGFYDLPHKEPHLKRKYEHINTKYRNRLCSKERQALDLCHKKNNVKNLVMFIGDRGTSVGSSLKGRRRHGGTWKQQNHARYTSECMTNENKTFQTCVYCFSCLSHPRATYTVLDKEHKPKVVKRMVKGAFLCRNPHCVLSAAKINTQTRDSISSVAIVLFGLATVLFQDTFPQFRTKISQSNTEFNRKIDNSN